MSASLTRADAAQQFLTLIAQFGPEWDSSVPQHAWQQLDAVNQALTQADKRSLMLHRKLPEFVEHYHGYTGDRK